MRVIALRLPPGRLATCQSRLPPLASRYNHHHSSFFSTTRTLRNSLNDPDASTPEDNEPSRPRVAGSGLGAGSGRRRSIARPKTGLPPPPPVPAWFFDYHVYEPPPSPSQHDNDDAHAHFMSKWSDARLMRFKPRRGPCLDIPHFPAETYRREFERLLLPVKSEPSQSRDESAAAGEVTPVSTENEGETPARPDASVEKQAAVTTQTSSDATGKKAPAGETSEAEKARLSEWNVRRKIALSEKVDQNIRDAIDSKLDDRPFTGVDWALFHLHLLVTSTLMLPRHATDRDSMQSWGHFLLSTTEFDVYSELESLLHDIVDMTGARLITLDACTISELAGDYIDGPNRGPGTVSHLPYDVYVGCEATLNNDDSSAEDREDDALDLSSPPDPRALLKKAKSMLGNVLNAFKEVAVPDTDPKDDNVMELTRWQALKLEAFWDDLLAARSAPNSSERSPPKADFTRPSKPNPLTTYLHRLQESTRMAASSSPATAMSRRPFDRHSFRALTRRTTLRLRLAQYMAQTQHTPPEILPLLDTVPLPPRLDTDRTKTIIHIRNLGVLKDTPQGQVIVQRLLKSVEKRVRNGNESIVVIGASANDVFSSDSQSQEDDNFLVVPVSAADSDKWRPSPPSPPHTRSPGEKAASTQSAADADEWLMRMDILSWNLRNIQAHARSLNLRISAELLATDTQSAFNLFSKELLAQAVLTREQVHEIVLFANGFCHLYTTDNEIAQTHISFAAAFLQPRFGVQDKPRTAVVEPKPRTNQTGTPTAPTGKPAAPRARVINMAELQRMCSSHERRLLPGLRHPSKIKTTFAQVHAPESTIDTLKTVTGLSLLRPDAFSYGVLADSRLSGLLLYGPPGTGKTMLAKAVAKDASCTVLEVSGAQIYDKYVGEGEKMVHAVFSLAKKLSPCIVFVDEADALFSTRSSDRNRTTHREIITQFLAEWDGMAEHNVFIMVATNRPFELDDAVLRRLPRRILVDLPTVADRKSILGIHLRGENLDDSVSLDALAEQTPFFSGSDLKNLCVAAALAAVKQENVLSKQHKGDENFKLPEKRTLTKNNFETAAQEISASISEDMESLKAIKKFDEKYGEGRDRRKGKKGFGFAVVARQDAGSGDAARVRSG